MKLRALRWCLLISGALGCGPRPERGDGPGPEDPVPPISSWTSLIEAPNAIFSAPGTKNDLFLVFEDRVARIDLVSGRELASAVVPTPARRVAVSSDRLFVLSSDEASATSEITVLAPDSGAVLATFSVPLAEEIEILSNEKLFLATQVSGYLVRSDDGRVEGEIQLSSGLIYGSFGMHELDGKVHVPRAYPGGIDVIQISDGALLETIPTGDWIHDVLKVEDHFVVTGHLDGVSIVRPGAEDIVIDVGESFAAHLLPYRDRSALVLANGAIHEVDLDGRIKGSWPLPDALRRDEGNDVLWRFDDWILRTHEGRALVFVHGKGAGWIELF